MFIYASSYHSAKILSFGILIIIQNPCLLQAEVMTLFKREYLKKIPATFAVGKNSRFTPANHW
jgi:hypothetical protein